MIYLEKFDTNTQYEFEIDSCNLKQIKSFSSRINGFVSFEKCGLFKKKATTHVISVFCLNEKAFLCVDNNLYDLKDVTIRTISFFIRVITIFYRKKKIFCCIQWTKDVDEFTMNDFFYFLHYSYKNDFENITSLCIQS